MSKQITRTTVDHYGADGKLTEKSIVTEEKWVEPRQPFLLKSVGVPYESIPTMTLNGNFYAESLIRQIEEAFGTLYKKQNPYKKHQENAE